MIVLRVLYCMYLYLRIYEHQYIIIITFSVQTIRKYTDRETAHFQILLRHVV